MNFTVPDPEIRHGGGTPVKPMNTRWAGIEDDIKEPAKFSEFEF